MISAEALGLARAHVSLVALSFCTWHNMGVAGRERGREIRVGGW